MKNVIDIIYMYIYNFNYKELSKGKPKVWGTKLGT